VHPDGELQPPFHIALHAFHIKAMSRRYCPNVRTVATLLHVTSIIRTASGRCCPVVRMVTIILHVLPYQGPRPDGVALSFEWMQQSSHICVCEGNPITCRTLMSVRTCYHDVRMDATLNYSNLLDTDGRPDDITTSFGRMLLTNEHLDALLGHPNRNKGFDFSELESTQNLP
jgi:hypothetical protein